jgi:hypothetical protein
MLKFIIGGRAKLRQSYTLLHLNLHYMLHSPRVTVRIWRLGCAHNRVTSVCERGELPKGRLRSHPKCINTGAAVDTLIFTQIFKRKEGGCPVTARFTRREFLRRSGMLAAGVSTLPLVYSNPALAYLSRAAEFCLVHARRSALGSVSAFGLRARL